MINMAPVILFLLSFMPIVLGNDGSKAYGSVLLLVFGIVGAFACYRKKDLFLFVTPSALVFFYTTISMALGAWGFSNGYVIILRDLTVYEIWRFAHIALTLLMLSLSILLSVDYYFHDRYLRLMTRSPLKVKHTQMLAATVLMPFFVVPLDLASLGGDGDLSVLPKSVFAVIFILYVSRYALAIRWLMYLALIASFAFFSIDDKREAIFLILPIVYLELFRSPQRLTFKLLGFSLTVATFLLVLILAMSVSRGYGSFGVFDNLLDAMPLVIAYLDSDIFISGVLYNIEANYFFFHAMNSIEMVFRDSSLISFGSTIIKPIFIFFPRDLVDWKPESIISLYTTAYDPGFRAIGGSWPTSLLSELVWNFSYFSFLAAVVLALLLVKLQLAILKSRVTSRYFKHAFLLYAYMNVLTVARGSGVDQYVVYLLIGGVFFVVCIIVSLVLKYGIIGRKERLCVEP